MPYVLMELGNIYAKQHNYQYEQKKGREKNQYQFHTGAVLLGFFLLNIGSSGTISLKLPHSFHVHMHWGKDI